MKHPLRSSVCTEGRRMAGARALWVATGMKHEHFGKPIIAVVNSFTQFVPGHTHLHEIGQIVKQEIEKMGTVAPKANNNWRFVPEKWTEPAAKRDSLLLFGHKRNPKEEK